MATQNKLLNIIKSSQPTSTKPQATKVDQSVVTKTVQSLRQVQQPTKPLTVDKKAQEQLTSTLSGTKPKTPTVAKPTMHKDITSSIGADGAIAIVDNKDMRGERAWATDYGYVHTKIPSLTDGTVVILDNKGNYTYVAPEDMSEDYKEQVDKFKLAHDMARDEYQVYTDAQEQAAEEAEQLTKHTSFLDLLCDIVAAGNPYSGKTEEEREAALDQVKRDVSDIGFQFARTFGMDDERKFWQDAYNDDPLRAIKELDAADMTDRKRDYLRYEMVTQDKTSKGWRIASDVFTEMGEDFDWLANPVKGTLIWLSYQDPMTQQDGGSTLDVQGKYYDYMKSHNLFDVVKSCYMIDADNEERAWYNYDTGCLPMDMVLEIFSDPETIVKIAKAVATSNAITDLVKGLSGEADVSTKAAKRFLATEDIDILVRSVPADAQAGVRRIAQDFIEYSTNYRVAKSLGQVLDVKSVLDDAAMLFIPKVVQKAFGKAFGYGMDIANTLVRDREMTLKAWLDAIAEVQGTTTNGMLTMETADQVMSYASRNIAAISACEGEAFMALTKQEKLDFITQLYAQETRTIKAEALDTLNAQTLDLLRRHDLQDSTLYKVLAWDDPINTMMDTIPYDAPEWAIRASNKLDEVSSTAADELTHFASDVSMDGKVYSIKLGSEVSADQLMSKQRLREVMYSDWLGVSITGQGTTALDNFTTDIRRYRTGYMNYESITSALESVPCTERMRKSLRDYLFNAGLQRRVNNSFVAGISGLSRHEIRMKTSALAKAWVDGAFGLEAKYVEEWADTFDELQCCTRDLDANLAHIKEQYNLLADTYKAHNTIPAFYTYTLDGNGMLAELAINYKGNVTRLTVRDGILDASQDRLFINMVTDAKQTNSQIAMVGFNAHPTGFNADKAIMTALSYNRLTHCSTMFKNTLDIADCLRIERGLPVPTPDIYEAAERIMDSCAQTWMRNEIGSTVRVKGYNPFSLIPPTESQIRTILNKYEAADINDATIRAAYNELDAWHTEVEHAYQQLHSGGKLAVDRADVMRELRTYYDHDIALKQVWDGEMVGRYFDWRHMDIENTEPLFEGCNAVERIRKQLKPGLSEMLESEINFCMEQTVMHMSDKADWYGIELTRLPHNTWSADQKLAWLIEFYNTGEAGCYHLYDAMPDSIRNQTYLMGEAHTEQRITMESVITNPYKYAIYSGTHKRFAVEEIFPGILGDNNNQYMNLGRNLQAMKRIRENNGTIIQIQEELQRQGYSRALGEYVQQAHAPMVDAFDELYSLYEDACNAQIASWQAMLHKFRENITPQGKVLFTDTHGGLFDNVNQSLYDYSVKRLNARAAYIAGLDADQLHAYVDYYCNGRLVVSKSELELLAIGDIRAALSRANIPFTEDEGYILVRGAEWTADEVPVLPKMDMDYGTMGEQPDMWRDAIQRFVDRMVERADESFSFGDFTATDARLQRALDNKFFPGEELPKMHRYDGYMTSYLGNIANLRNVPGTNVYVSNNPLMNMLNAYASVSKLHTETADLLSLVFSGGKFKVQQELAHMGGLPEGYVIASLQFHKGLPELVEVNHLRFAADDCAILTYNDFHALNNRIKAQRYIKVTKNPVVKTLGKLQSLFIQGYLFTNPETWVRNWVDSTTKGVLSEGFSHFGYMQQALEINSVWSDIYDDIVKKYHNINQDIVQHYFRNVDVSTITKGINVDYDTFMDVWKFKTSSVSDGKVRSIMAIINDEAVDTDKWSWWGWNAKQFEKCEDTNRLAIYLNELDRGRGSDAALKRVALSQFDYSQTKNMGALNKLTPFLNFTIQNYRYWLADGVADDMRFLEADLMQAFNRESDFDDEYWSEDGQRYRAYIASVVHSMNQLQHEYGKDSTAHQYTYDMFKDYDGTRDSIAAEQGWLRIGDRLFFKAGLSMVDTAGVLTRFTPEGIMDDLFAPIKTLFNPEFYDAIKSIGKMDAGEWFTAYGYTVANVLPVVGMLMTRAMQTVRNLEYGKRDDVGFLPTMLSTVSPNLFALAENENKYTLALKQSYLLRAIGTDWYSREDHTDERFVMGMSYVNAWVAKNPATYINTFGRMQQMGLTQEQVTKLMEDGGGFYFTINNDGEYKLNNHMLQIGDEDTYFTVLKDLLSFGWSREEAVSLMEQCSERTWYKSTYEDVERVYGHSGASHGYKRFAGAKLPRTPWNVKQLTEGKYASTTRVRNTRDVRVLTTYVNWHKRERNIYHDLYAKYGASRMAMRQNPRAYSNRSITEMYRTNAQQRYARIHRHTRW